MSNINQLVLENTKNNSKIKNNSHRSKNWNRARRELKDIRPAGQSVPFKVYIPQLKIGR